MAGGSIVTGGLSRHVHWLGVKIVHGRNAGDHRGERRRDSRVRNVGEVLLLADNIAVNAGVKGIRKRAGSAGELNGIARR